MLTIVNDAWDIRATKGVAKDGIVTVEFKHDVQREGNAITFTRMEAAVFKSDLDTAVTFATAPGHGWGGQRD